MKHTALDNRRFQKINQYSNQTKKNKTMKTKGPQTF